MNRIGQAPSQDTPSFMGALLSFGQDAELVGKLTTRWDMLASSMEAKLPKRGYFKH